MTSKTEASGTKDGEIMVPFKYLINFWRTYKMPLINCEINLILTSCANCFTIADPLDNKGPTFASTDTKLYVPVLSSSSQNNAKFIIAIKIRFQKNN